MVQSWTSAAYELAEKLMDLETAFRFWRFRHVTTVERIIGVITPSRAGRAISRRCWRSSFSRNCLRCAHPFESPKIRGRSASIVQSDGIIAAQQEPVVSINSMRRKDWEPPVMFGPLQGGPFRYGAPA